MSDIKLKCSTKKDDKQQKRGGKFQQCSSIEILFGYVLGALKVFAADLEDSGALGGNKGRLI